MCYISTVRRIRLIHTGHMCSFYTHTFSPQFPSLFTLDYLGSSQVDSLLRVQKMCNEHSPPLTSPNIACFCSRGCTPAYHHILDNFLKSDWASRSFRRYDDSKLAQMLPTCKNPVHQTPASLLCSVDLRIFLRLADSDQSLYVTALATCKRITFQFIP